jgi:hypothetical protein
MPIAFLPFRQRFIDPNAIYLFDQFAEDIPDPRLNSIAGIKPMFA